MPKVKIYESKEWLRLQYLINNIGIEDMARLASCSPNTIRTNLKKHGLMR